MSTRSVLLAALALALASAACQPPAQEAGPLSEEDVAAIRAAAQSYTEAMLTGDWAAAVAVFTEDAVRMPPNAPAIQGHEAIRAGFEAEPVTYTDFTNTPTEIDGRGDLAYARGPYSLTFTLEGIAEPITDRGKYVAIFRKQADGSWLAAVDTWNSDLPLPEEGAETES